MRSPRCSVRSQKKMPGPVRESTCPAMMAEPIVPGRGLPVNQPATVVLDGTWSVPSRLTPRWISLVRIASDGMLSQVGRAACGPVASVAGRTVCSVGAGIGAGRGGSGAACTGDRAEVASPAAPTPTASSPAPSAATAASRRGDRGEDRPAGRSEDRRSQGRCRAVHRPKVVPATCRHDGGASAASVSGAACAGVSRMPRSGTVTPGVCIFCQAGSHQSSGGQVSTGIGPVGPLYPIPLPIPTGRLRRLSGKAEYTRSALIQRNEKLRPLHSNPPAPVPSPMVPNGPGSRPPQYTAVPRSWRYALPAVHSVKGALTWPRARVLSVPAVLRGSAGSSALPVIKRVQGSLTDQRPVPSDHPGSKPELP